MGCMTVEQYKHPPRGRRGYQKDLARYERRFSEDESLEPIDPLAIDYLSALSPTLQATTETLSQKLKSVGVKDPWLINMSAIYERSIIHLAGILQDVPTLGSIEQPALEELYTIADILYNLFSGQIRLKLMYTSAGSSNLTHYEGYQKDNQKDKRILIKHRGNWSLSTQRHNIIPPSCQIITKEVIGRSTLGAAIAGSDAELRCGLRCNVISGTNTFIWSISLDSGISIPEEHDRKWKSIGPLSQAIYQAKIDPESSINLADGEYTFHYDDPESILKLPVSPYEQTLWYRKYHLFNQSLGRIFQIISTS